MTLNEIVNMHLEHLINGFPVNFNGNREQKKTSSTAMGAGLMQKLFLTEKSKHNFSLCVRLSLFA